MTVYQQETIFKTQQLNRKINAAACDQKCVKRQFPFHNNGYYYVYHGPNKRPSKLFETAVQFHDFQATKAFWTRLNILAVLYKI